MTSLVRDELGGRLVNADFAQAVQKAHALKQRQVARQQGFTDMEARMRVLFHQHHVAAAFGQQGCGRGTGRSAADHQNITVLHGVGSCHDWC